MPKNSIRRRQSDISREEWILYNWVNVTEMQDEEPIYIRVSSRSIARSVDAAREWDTWWEAYAMLHPNAKPPESINAGQENI